MDFTYMIIILITIFMTDVEGIILKQMNKMNIDMEEILYSSQNKESLFQCAHKCRLIDKDAAVVFRGSECKCVRYQGKEKEMDDESLSGVFVNQVTEKEVHACHKPTKGGCSDFCHKNGDGVLCSCQEGYVMTDDEKTCKKIANVALGKAATQSSTIPGYPASDAVDGTTSKHSETLKEDDPWWMIDMGKLRKIMEIQLNAFSHIDYNKGLIVETKSEESGNWVVCKNVGDIEIQVLKFKCDNQPTYGRLLRIRATKKCYLQFYEVDIVGY